MARRLAGFATGFASTFGSAFETGAGIAAKNRDRNDRIKALTVAKEEKEEAATTAVTNAKINNLAKFIGFKDTSETQKMVASNKIAQELNLPLVDIKEISVDAYTAGLSEILADPKYVKENGELDEVALRIAVGGWNSTVSSMGTTKAAKEEISGEAVKALVAGKAIQPVKVSTFETDPETGKTIKVTTEDGRVVAREEQKLAAGEVIESLPGGGFRITRGGSTVTGLTRKTVNDLQETLVNVENDLSNLRVIKGNFDKEFLTWFGRLKNKFLKWKDFAFGELSPEDEKFFKSRRIFVQDVNRFFNQYRKNITGAQATLKEIETLKNAVINEDLSPTQFEAALEGFENAVRRSGRLTRRILREGFEGEFGAALDTLFVSGDDDDTEIRGQELRDAGLSDDQIVDKLIQEGYQ